MKRNKRIETIAVLLNVSICLAVYAFSNNKFHKTKADGVQLEQIGTFYTYDRVSANTKVIVTGSMINLAEDAGRTVEVEYVDGGFDPIDPPIFPGILGGNPSNPDSIHHPVPQYYYIATPTDGILKAKYTLYNNINSLKIVLNQLKNDADFLSANYNFNDINNNVASYLRTINTDYKSVVEYMTFPPGVIDYNNSNSYFLVCGSDNTSFIQNIDSVYSSTSGIRIVDYLSAFANGFNNSYHPNVVFSLKDAHKLIVDPLLEGEGIDIIHEFASIDGIALNTGAHTSDPLLQIIAGENFYRTSVSWGGDLEQSADYGRSLFTQGAISFEDILNNGTYRFPWSDLLADIDAISIAFNYSMNSSTSIIDKIASYYDNLISQSSRITSYVNKASIMSEYNLSTSILNFKKYVFHLVALEYVNDSNINDEYSAHLYSSTKWKFLSVSQSTIPTIQERTNAAYSFYSFIINYYQDV